MLQLKYDLTTSFGKIKTMTILGETEIGIMDTYEKVHNQLLEQQECSKQLMAARPAKLYKYYKYNENLIDSVLTGIIKVTNPLDFNDLYDCFIAGENEHWPYTDVDNRSLLINSYRIACFSADPTSILMWAHYADNNHGICVEYDISSYSDLNNGKDQFASILPVIYKDSPIDFSALLDPSVRLYKKNKFLSCCFDFQILRKPKVWSYENEWRLCLQLTDENKNKIIRKGENELFQFLRPSSLILGARFDHVNEEVIRERYKECNIYRIRQSKTEYRLKIIAPEGNEIS